MLFGVGLATKIYLAIEAVDMRKGFEGLYGAVRDQLGPRSGERPSVFIHQQNQDAIESSGVGRQRLVGVREASGEGAFPLAGSGRQAQRHDAIGGVGDAGERSGCEAHAAAQLVSQKRVKRSRIFARNSRKIELPLWLLPIHRCALRLSWNASFTGRN